MTDQNPATEPGVVPSTDPKDVEKVRSLMEKVDIAMVTTIDATSTDGRLTSRPLSTQLAEEDGDALFLVRRTSAFARDVSADPRVNVAYSSMKAWVSVAGTAQIIDDRSLVNSLWSKGADMFMDGGPENPENIVVKVSTDTASLWGGESLIGTAVKMVKSVASRSDENGQDQGGPTVVQLP